MPTRHILNFSSRYDLLSLSVALSCVALIEHSKIYNLEYVYILYEDYILEKNITIFANADFNKFKLFLAMKHLFDFAVYVCKLSISEK